NSTFHQWQIDQLKKNLIENQGDANRTRLTLAQRLNEGAFYDEAIETLHSINSPGIKTSLEYNESLATAFIYSGQTDRAMKLLREMQDRFSDSKEITSWRAWLLLSMPESDAKLEAQELAETLVKDNPSVDNLGLLGLALKANKEWSRAEKVLLKALEKAYHVHYTYRYHLKQVQDALKAQNIASLAES
ncbi:MAG: hypothetical protein ABIK28_14835, partial [Planctomycetota bacterium]